MEIPYKELSAATLAAIIEEYITREGTDYGDREYTLAQKVEQVKKQLERGDIYLSFDPESETCHLAAREQSAPASPKIAQDD